MKIIETGVIIILVFVFIGAFALTTIILNSMDNGSEAANFCQDHDLKLAGRQNEDMATCIGIVTGKAQKYEILRIDGEWYFEGGWKE